MLSLNVAMWTHYFSIICNCHADICPNKSISNKISTISISWQYLNLIKNIHCRIHFPYSTSAIFRCSQFVIWFCTLVCVSTMYSFSLETEFMRINIFNNAYNDSYWAWQSRLFFPLHAQCLQNGNSHYIATQWRN